MNFIQTHQSDTTAFKKALLIALAIVAVYVLIGTRTTLWDRDEPRFARAAVEMVESGNYLVPTLNGRLWADKPILFYWLLSLSIRLFGPSEFALRLFAAIGTASTCLLTFFIARRLWNARTGLWAMVILATTLMMFATGSIATIDAVLLPLLTAIMLIFTLAMTAGRCRFYHVIGMGVALGLAMLAKGPVAALPVFAMLATGWLSRKRLHRPGRWLWQLAIALLLGAVIFCAWALPADRATNGEFLRIFFGRHVLGRALRPMEHHGGRFLLYLPYYLPVIICGFFPWVLHLPGAFSALLAGRLTGHEDQIENQKSKIANRKSQIENQKSIPRALLIGWIVPAVILMSLAATKLPHYILFIWPGLALATAGTIVAAENNRLAECDRRWLRGGIWFFGPVAAGGSLALMVGVWFLPVSHLQWPCLAAGLILAALAVLAIRYQLADRPIPAAKVLIAGMLCFNIPLVFGVLPAVEQLKISPPIAEAVNEKTPKQTAVATYEYGEPSLNFYVGRKIERLHSEPAVVEWTRQPKPGVLIIPKKVLNDIEQRYKTLPLEQIASKKGLNLTKGNPLEVLALIREAKEQ